MFYYKILYTGDVREFTKKEVDEYLKNNPKMCCENFINIPGIKKIKCNLYMDYEPKQECKKINYKMWQLLHSYYPIFGDCIIQSQKKILVKDLLKIKNEEYKSPFISESFKSSDGCIITFK